MKRKNTLVKGMRVDKEKNTLMKGIKEGSLIVRNKKFLSKKTS